MHNSMIIINSKWFVVVNDELTIEHSYSGVKNVLSIYADKTLERLFVCRGIQIKFNPPKKICVKKKGTNLPAVNM